MYKITVPVLIDNEYFDKEGVLSELKRCRANRVALAVNRNTGYAFSSPETLQKLKNLIEYYQTCGFETLVWLGETFGHNPFGAKSDKYTNMKKTGGARLASLCPLDPKFREDFCTWVKDVARCGATMIMLDDDFRFALRGDDGGIECCCDLHMAKINEILGENLTCEQLGKKAFAGGKNKYRDSWLKVNGDAMREFAKAMRDALDTVNPKARLGFCCAPTAWDINGVSPVELANIMAGKTKPFVRLCGAPYWNWAKPSHVAEYVRLQSSWLKNEDIEFFAEGDTYPRPRFATPASHLECFDQIVRADGNCGGMLKYMLDYVSHARYETGYIDFHEKNQKLYDSIRKLFDGKQAIGVIPANCGHIMQNMDMSGDEDLKDCQHNLFGGRLNCAIDFAIKTSLPTAYGGSGVNIVFGENAKYIAEDALKNGAIIDLPAAKILAARGIDVGIEDVKKVTVGEATGFTDLPYEHYIGENVYTRLASFDDCNVKYKPGAKVVTQIVRGNKRLTGTVQYKNSDGMAFVIFCTDAKNAPFGYFETYARRRQMIKSIEWMQGKKVPVDLCGNYPYMYMMLKENEKAYAVGLWNIFPDRAENVKLKINTDLKKIKFINCKGHCDAKEICIDCILPYEFAGIEIKKSKVL